MFPNMKWITIFMTKMYTIKKLFDFFNKINHIFQFCRGEYYDTWQPVISTGCERPPSFSLLAAALPFPPHALPPSPPHLNTVYSGSKYRGRYLNNTFPCRAVCGSVCQTIVQAWVKSILKLLRGIPLITIQVVSIITAQILIPKGTLTSAIEPTLILLCFQIQFFQLNRTKTLN